jgi:hypothetical protein
MKQYLLDILQNTSIHNIEFVLEKLEKNYVTSGTRKAVYKLLKLILTYTKPDRAKENEIILLQNIFSKSTAKNGYIDIATKNKAKEFIQKMKDTLQEEESKWSDAENLRQNMEILSLNEKETKEIQRKICFRKLLQEKEFIPELSEALDCLQTTQYTIRSITSQIYVFGVLIEDDFWSKLEKLWKKSDNLPDFEIAKEIIVYFGGREAPLPNPEDHFTPSNIADSLKLSGNRIDSLWSIFDQSIISQIPEKKDKFDGTIGGFIIDETTQKIYAVTAAHCVSKLHRINTLNFIFRGDYDQYYLDVAFLPLESGTPMGNLRNLLGHNDDFSVYTEYWSEFISDFISDSPSQYEAKYEGVFPPGSLIQKIGIESGFTEGYLLDMQASPKVPKEINEIQPSNVSDGKSYWERKGMVAVRWKPCDPFTISGDSGSIYYVVQGCMKTPIAVHSLTSSYESSHHKAMVIQDDEVKPKTAMHEMASFGSRFSICIEWFESVNNTTVKFFNIH